MEQEKWERLKAKMAVRVITMDLADRMVPSVEGEQRALNLQKQRTQDYLSVEYRMGQALIALEEMGYKVNG